MAQHDQVIDNGPGLAVRTDINAALAALFSSSSGSIEPAVMVAGQLWFNTTAGKLQLRNAANTAWQGLTGELGGTVTLTSPVSFSGTSTDVASPLIEVLDTRTTTTTTGNAVFSINRQNSDTEALIFGNDGNGAALIGGNNVPIRVGNWVSGVFTERTTFAADGAVTFRGNLEIASSAPQIRFNDTDGYDYWLHINANVFYVLADRNADGTWETPHPLELQAANNTGWLFGSQIYTTGNLPAYDTASTGSTLARRDGSGDINARLFRTEYTVTNAAIASIMTQQAIGGAGANNYMRPSTPAQVAAALSGLVSPEVYTGTTSANTAFPVGSIISAYLGGAAGRNATHIPCIHNGNANAYITSTNANAGAALAGTWRTRGQCDWDTGVYLLQRVV
jgi:hypothetical protein